MDDIDKRAIELLVNAPLLDDKELKNVIRILKKLARAKKRNSNIKKSINDILDYWAKMAYEVTI